VKKFKQFITVYVVFAFLEKTKHNDCKSKYTDRRVISTCFIV